MDKIPAQPHSIVKQICFSKGNALCIQFLDRENNDKNNALALGKQICLTMVRGYVEILPQFCYNI